MGADVCVLEVATQPYSEGLLLTTPVHAIIVRLVLYLR